MSVFRKRELLLILLAGILIATGLQWGAAWRRNVQCKARVMSFNESDLSPDRLVKFTYEESQRIADDYLTNNVFVAPLRLRVIPNHVIWHNGQKLDRLSLTYSYSVAPLDPATSDVRAGEISVDAEIGAVRGISFSYKDETCVRGFCKKNVRPEKQMSVEDRAELANRILEAHFRSPEEFDLRKDVYDWDGIYIYEMHRMAQGASVEEFRVDLFGDGSPRMIFYARKPLVGGMEVKISGDLASELASTYMRQCSEDAPFLFSGQSGAAESKLTVWSAPRDVAWSYANWGFQWQVRVGTENSVLARMLNICGAIVYVDAYRGKMIPEKADGSGSYQIIPCEFEF